MSAAEYRAKVQELEATEQRLALLVSTVQQRRRRRLLRDAAVAMARAAGGWSPFDRVTEGVQ